MREKVRLGLTVAIAVVAIVSATIVKMRYDDRAAARQAMAPKVDALVHGGRIDEGRQVDELCGQYYTGVHPEGRVACTIGNYPVVYMGHRMNFTEVQVEYWDPLVWRRPSVAPTARAILTIDPQTRRARLVRYEY